MNWTKRGWSRVSNALLLLASLSSPLDALAALLFSNLFLWRSRLYWSWLIFLFHLSVSMSEKSCHLLPLSQWKDAFVLALHKSDFYQAELLIYACTNVRNILYRCIRKCSFWSYTAVGSWWNCLFCMCTSLGKSNNCTVRFLRSLKL